MRLKMDRNGAQIALEQLNSVPIDVFTINFMGDYTGTATFSTGGSIGVWTDTRNTTGDLECSSSKTDIYAATAPATSFITVTVPNGGETWPINSTQTIQWTSQGVSGDVKIELSRNGGTTWETLFASTPNDGSQPWTVTGPTTSQARIRVSSINDPSVSDISDANFTIYRAPR